MGFKMTPKSPLTMKLAGKDKSGKKRLPKPTFPKHDLSDKPIDTHRGMPKPQPEKWKRMQEVPLSKKLPKISNTPKQGTVVTRKNKKSPAKLKKGEGVMIGGKEYPKGYTKKDVVFLKKQREDVVRYEDLDAKGKAIYDAKRKNKKPLKAKKAKLKAKGAKVLDFDNTVGKSKKSPAKLVGTGKRIGPGYADKIKRDREREEAKRKEQGKKMRKIALKDKTKETTKAKKKTNTVGTGFMQPPYKDTVKGSRPYAKRQGYHGYKNFKSILKK